MPRAKKNGNSNSKNPLAKINNSKNTADTKSTGDRTVRRFKKKTSPSPSGVNREIEFLIFTCICVLLAFSMFGLGGSLGKSISFIFFGLMGIMAYIVPFLIFSACCFYLANKENPLAVRKIVGGISCFIFLCVLVQLFIDGSNDGAGIFEHFLGCANEKTGGGLIGGGLLRLFSLLFGEPGAYVLTFIGMLISLIVMTQRPLIHQFRDKSKDAYKKARTAVDTQKRKKGGTFHIEHLDLSKELKKKRQGEEPEVPLFIDRGDLVVEEEEPVKSETVEIHNVSESTPVITNLDPVSSDADEIHEKTQEQDITGGRRIRNPKSSKEEIEHNIANIKSEIKAEPGKKKKAYRIPPLKLLKAATYKRGDSDAQLRETAAKLQQTLLDFDVDAAVTNASCGPTVTRFEIQPGQGVKVNKIKSLEDDIKLKLAATDIRIEAPIPGKSAVGIEVPNRENSAVMLRELIQSEAFVHSKANLSFAVGKDIAGKAVVADIARMPHLLIAGATGSGKSVCINTLIISLLYKSHPDDVKLILIDPKVVELSVYNGIPHLMIPVVTDAKKAAGALNWAVAEMTDRYNKFAEYNVRDLKSYNDKVALINRDPAMPEEDKPKKMPQIVIIVDELADLMMVAPGEVEDAICRLAQLARAAGIHLIIATQRPSVNVITGLIKANMPSRIAFAVTSGVDSRTILDMNGAEKLLGKGDMLYYPQGYPKPVRLQGALVTEEEVSAVVKFISSQQGEVVYNSDIENKIISVGASANGAASPSSERDAYFVEAGKFIIEKDKASIGMLQRVFKIGFNRAARIMDQLCEAGVVGDEEGTKPRKVLMSMEQFEQYVDEVV